MTALVLLPGMDGTGNLFRPFMEALPPGLSVTVVSYPPQEPLGYLELERIAADSSPSDGPIFLLGESFSGPLAIRLASKLGPRVLGVILRCTFVRCPMPLLARIPWLSAFLPVGLIPSTMIAPMILGRSAERALCNSLNEVLASVEPSVLRRRLREVATIDVSQELRSCNAPILSIQATDDWLIRSAAVDALRAAHPGMRSVTIRGPHGLLQVNPSGAADTVVDFIKTVEASSGHI